MNLTHARQYATPLGSYKGSVLDNFRVCMTALVAILFCCVAFWLLRKEWIWYEAWQQFWYIESPLIIFGMLLATLPFILVWLVIPGFVFVKRKRAEGYVRYREDPWKWAFLITFTAIACLMCSIVAPAATIQMSLIGLKDAVLGGLALFYSIAGITFIYRLLILIRRIFRYSEPATPQLLDFRSQFEPQNTRVLNLDVGALAPRLNVVADGLIAWSRVVDGSAPTARLWWDVVSGSTQAMPKQWKRNLKNATWKGIEEFRAHISNVCKAETSVIYFFSSTTRALDVVLRSIPDYDAIVTTDLEHPSEQRLFQTHSKRKQNHNSEVKSLPIVQIALLDILKDGKLYKLPNLFAEKCKRFTRPICVISHIPFCVGVKLPLSEIAHSLRAACPNAQIVFDGAHAVGQVEVDLTKLDFDFYVFSGHKWLYGPPSLGIMIIGPPIRSKTDILDSIKLECYESLSYAGNKLGESGSTIALEPFVGLSEFLGQLHKYNSLENIFENIKSIRLILHEYAKQAKQFEIISFPGIAAEEIAPGLLNVQKKVNPLNYPAIKRLRDLLEEDYSIVTKDISAPVSLRLCLPFYLSRLDVDRLVTSLDDAFLRVSVK